MKKNMRKNMRKRKKWMKNIQSRTHLLLCILANGCIPNGCLGDGDRRSYKKTKFECVYYEFL